MNDDTVSFAPEEINRDRIVRRFDELKRKFSALVPGADIQRVGSTAVPGSLTKGDLDIQVRVSRSEYAGARERLRGMFAVNEGGFVSDEAVSFEDYSGEVPVGIHLTVAEGNCDIQWMYRDLLKASASLRREYDALKSRFEGCSMEDYREAKAEFIGRVLSGRRL